MGTTNKFVATKRVNLQSGSHDCCAMHAAHLIMLVIELKQVFTTSVIREDVECASCINDDMKKEVTPQPVGHRHT